MQNPYICSLNYFFKVSHMSLYLMPHREPKHKGLFNNLSEGFANLKQKVVDIKEEIKEDIKEGFNQLVVKPLQNLAAEKAVTVTDVQEVVAKAVDVVETDENEVYVLNLLGDTWAAKNFYKEVLMSLAVPSLDIRKFLDKILNLKLLTAAEILELPKADIKALFELSVIAIGGKMEMYQVFRSLSLDSRQRISYWLETVYIQDMMLCGFAWPSTGISEQDFEMIARHYIKESAKEPDKKVSGTMMVLKIAFILSSGMLLPKNSTIRMGCLWYMMTCCMLQYNNYRRYDFMTPMAMAAMLTFELMLHLCSYEIKTTIDFIGNPLGRAADAVSSSNNTQAEQSKYHCWNKTLSVLTNIAPLSEAQAVRMVYTYALAVNVKDTLNLELDLPVVMKRLSPIPVRQTVYDIITLYRDKKEYENRKNDVFRIMNRKVAFSRNMTDRFKFSYQTYFMLLKLKVAFCPNELCSGIQSCFIDPTDMDINSDIVDEVCRQQYIKADNYLVDKYRLVKYNIKLRQIIKNNPSPEYMDFFGKPKNLFFGSGHKVKYYLK